MKEATFHRPLTVVIGVLVFYSLAVFALDAAANIAPKHGSWAQIEPETQLQNSASRNSEFNDVAHAGVIARCEDVQLPVAITTPRPLSVPVRDDDRVRVSFIIGTDGRVHSPLILESAGPLRDRNVLLAVRHWKFRPATCNGVPTEIEDKIEFSSR